MADSYYWSPNIDLSDYYTGAMDPFKPYVMTPGAVPYNTNLPLSTDLPSKGLSSRSAPTVPINPSTGMPYKTTVSGSYGGGVGHGYAAQGAVTYQAPRLPAQANPLPGVRDLGSPQYGIPGSGGGVLTKSGLPPGSTVDKTYTQRVPSQLPAIAGGYGKAGVGGFGSGALTAVPPSPKSSGVIKLNSTPISDISGQNTANSFGKPVEYANGKVYYPSNTPMSGVRAPYTPNASNVHEVVYQNGIPYAVDPKRGLIQLGGGRSGFGGLLGGLFGGLLGMNAGPRAAGFVPGIGAASAAARPSLGYNAAYAQSAPGDGQGNNGISGDGHWGGARSLTE